MTATNQHERAFVHDTRRRAARRHFDIEALADCARRFAQGGSVTAGNSMRR